MQTDLLLLTSASLAAAEGRRWVSLAYPGTFRGHSAGTFTLNRDRFDEAVRNFNDRGLPVPFDINHASEDPDQNWRVEVAAAKGWAHALRVTTNDELEGLCELVDPDALREVRAKPSRLPFLSPAFRLSARHPETGREIGLRLTSVALCTQPFLSRQAPLSLTDAERRAVSRVDALLSDPLCGFAAADRSGLIRRCIDDPEFFEKIIAKRAIPAHLRHSLADSPARAPRQRDAARNINSRNLPDGVGVLNAAAEVAAEHRRAIAHEAAIAAELEARRAAAPPPPTPPPTPFELALPAAARAAAPALYEAESACELAVEEAEKALVDVRKRAVRLGSRDGLIEAAGDVELARAQLSMAREAVAEHERNFPAAFRAQLAQRHVAELAAFAAASGAVPLNDIRTAVEALASALEQVEKGIMSLGPSSLAAHETGRLLGLVGTPEAEPHGVTWNDVESTLASALSTLGRLSPTPRAICVNSLRRFVV